MNRIKTRAKTRAKNDNDWTDIKYLIVWLAEQEWKIEFNKYEGKKREDLLLMVRQVYQALVDDDDEELLTVLEGIMYPVDWQDMCGIVLPLTVEEEGFAPSPERMEA